MRVWQPICKWVLKARRLQTPCPRHPFVDYIIFCMFGMGLRLGAWSVGYWVCAYDLLLWAVKSCKGLSKARLVRYTLDEKH